MANTPLILEGKHLNNLPLGHIIALREAAAAAKLAEKPAVSAAAKPVAKSVSATTVDPTDLIETSLYLTQHDWVALYENEHYYDNHPFTDFSPNGKAPLPLEPTDGVYKLTAGMADGTSFVDFLEALSNKYNDPVETGVFTYGVVTVPETGETYLEWISYTPPSPPSPPPLDYMYNITGEYDEETFLPNWGWQDWAWLYFRGSDRPTTNTFDLDDPHPGIFPHGYDEDCINEQIISATNNVFTASYDNTDIVFLPAHSQTGKVHIVGSSAQRAS
jgi:hypothetical protein